MDMTTLRRKVLGKAFRSKIDRLEVAFALASAPFHAEIKQIEREAEAFQRKVDAGEANWVQTTEDGDYYDYGEDLAERREDAREALLTLRKAFTLLIYHQWERLAQHWAKPGKAPNHEDLVKAVKAAGVQIDEQGLEVLRLLVNTLKHNNPKCGSELYNIRPDLFKEDFNPNGVNPASGNSYTIIAWADQIELTDENIDEFIRISRDSSPR